MMTERFELCCGRLKEITNEQRLPVPVDAYFAHAAQFLLKLCKLYKEIEAGSYFDCERKQLAVDNEALYAELKPGRYEESFACPDYAAKMLGEKLGPLLSLVYAELRSAIGAVFEQELSTLVIRLELFLELYTSFTASYEEDKREPDYEQIRELVYFYFFDYADEEAAGYIKKRLDPGEDFAYRILTEADLSETDYLYRYGEYITQNQILTAQYLAKADEEEIRLMADTFTEGYRIGFEKAGKELGKKGTVQIIYPIGFERMIRKAVQNFEKMGLKPVLNRTPHSIFIKRSLSSAGFYSESPNRQYEYDHREDEALILDKKLANRKLETQRQAYEQQKEAAALMAGPAVVEVFGETPFSPAVSTFSPHFSTAQQELSTWYAGKLSQLVNEYIPGEERSFTIIAFPTPEIGGAYEEIMRETIKLNTLDYQTYESVQQAMIDALDRADYVCVKGSGENKTDLKIILTGLSDSEKETKFENCVADVNIPVGEIFTSPRLKGTQGILHVSKVFLNGLAYHDLEIVFEDGFVKDYACKNFENAGEGRRLILENVLHHHETLPMGEFAIGTNTTAYVMGQKYEIQDRLPILIAEKTGPHFALGDTCYSREEEIALYNPDGKEIIARDNEVSILRKTDVDKAYFQCHTDITIPYDELGALYGVTAGGEEIWIIKDGRFVLDKARLLNEAFEEK